MGCPTVDEMLAACEQYFADLEAQQPCPENRATLRALRDARAWQQCRERKIARALFASARRSGSRTAVDLAKTLQRSATRKSKRK